MRVFVFYRSLTGLNGDRSQILVPTARLELAQLSPLPPQDSVSTNSTTSANAKNAILARFLQCVPALIKNKPAPRAFKSSPGSRHAKSRANSIHYCETPESGDTPSAAEG